MKNIRIGNDLNVAWSIVNRQTNEPLSLEGRDIHLYLRTPFGRQSITDFSTHDNVVSWTFLGKSQKHTGKYSLELVINENEKGMVTTDACNFVNLVACSCDVGGSDEFGVQTESIELESQIDFGESYDDTGIKKDISDLKEKDAQTDTKLAKLSEEIVKKQDALVSGENIKTINGQSLLGEGDIEIKGAEGGATPDWNAKEGEEGYIKNRTHYLENLEVYFATDGDEHYVSLGTECYIIYGKNIMKMVLEEGKNQICSGPPTYLNAKIEKGRAIATLEDAYGYHLSNPIYLYSGCRTLNEVFIPDTIARKTDLADYVQMTDLIQSPSAFAEDATDLSYRLPAALWYTVEGLSTNRDSYTPIKIWMFNQLVGLGACSVTIYMHYDTDAGVFPAQVDFTTSKIIWETPMNRYEHEVYSNTTTVTPLDKASKTYVDEAIAAAITSTLNTEV